MTTSITSVNAGTTAASESAVKKSSLSNETKAKLAALGISETDGMTEAQANALIASAQQNQGAGQQEQGQNGSSESEILSRAKTLAQTMGLTVEEDADTDEILNDIGAELEAMLEEAENNPSILPSISSYLTTLTGLDSQYDKLQSMYAAMDMMSETKKQEHGLG